jgi:hypothetical protein
MDPDWNLPVFAVSGIDPGTTEVKLSNLRFPIDESDIPNLREYQSVTYAHFLKEERLRLVLNDEPVCPRFFNQWAYPPEWKPKGFVKWLSHRDKTNIKFQIVGGLTTQGGSIGGEYGVYIYCNDRLILRAARTPELGFASGLAGVPHPRMSLARVIVDFNGPSADMPWTSNKAGINYTHFVFRAVRKDIWQMVKTFTGLSKSLQSEFDEKIAPFATGSVQIEKLEKAESIRPSYLPRIPPRVPNYQDQVLELNRALAEDKPWVRGLYEGLLAFTVVSKQHRLEQRNRILLIILDSTLEIAFKKYLANELRNPLGDEKLAALFNNRMAVHAALEKHIFTGDPIWKKIRHFYRLRCDLIHKRANPGLSDDAIEDYRKVVVRFLHKAFNIRFPEDI